MADAFNWHLARIAVGAYDDAQEQRKAMMNRIRDLIRKRNEDIPMDAVEDEIPPEERNYDAKYQDDNLLDLVADMKDRGLFSDDEFDYIQQMLEAGQAAARVENRYQDVMRIVQAEPIFSEWLQHVSGIGHTTAARLLYHYGYCEDFPKPSNIWKYSGLSPGQRPKRGEKLGYSPDAKKLLCYQIPTNLLRSGSRYRDEFYDPYKKEQVRRGEESRCQHCGEPSMDHLSPKGDSDHYCPDTGKAVDLSDFAVPGAGDNATPPWSDGHADRRAKRYLGKKFLKHYWYIARDLRGLSTPDEWVIAHGGHEKEEDTFENPAHARRVLAPAEPPAE